MSVSTARPVGPRRGFGRVLAEMHYRLRTEGESPARKALAIWCGTVIGCVPIYGAHLALCIVVARLFGLSRITTYLAAHVNNPITAPGLLYLAYGVGGTIFGGRWPALNMETLRGTTLWSAGRDLLVGSLVIGVVLGTLLGVVSYFIGIRWRRSPPTKRLIEVTSLRYLSTGIFHWEFVRGKLKFDPVYRHLLASGHLPDEGRLLDLGCGRGILLALLREAPGLYRAGVWDDWPPPPRALDLHGVELQVKHARVARTALGPDARIEHADLLDYVPPPSAAIVMIDVLHYLTPADQVQLIARACRAVAAGGVLLIREADADRGVRFQLTRVQERLSAILRMRWRQPLHYRSAANWSALLADGGLTVTAQSLWHGTPFANVLIVGRRESAGC